MAWQGVFFVWWKIHTEYMHDVEFLSVGISAMLVRFYTSHDAPYAPHMPHAHYLPLLSFLREIRS